MRILYGIQTTGNGHITRSIEVINKLLELGCDVDILLSGNNSDNIVLPFPVKWRFKGFTLKYNQEGELSLFDTAFNIDIITFIRNIKLDVKQYDKVVSDFEPITTWACKKQKVDCIGVGNQYSFLSKKIPRPSRKSFLSEVVLKYMAPVKKYMGIHYHEYDNNIKKPIIKSELLSVNPKQNNYYCVYLPYIDLEILSNEFFKFKENFQIFGLTNFKYKIKNCMVYPIDKIGFNKSLINSQGVITHSGFQTTSEALFLNKKLLVSPISGQYEQECNTLALNQIGVESFKIGDDISNFFNNDFKYEFQWNDPLNEIVNFILKH